MTPVLELQDLHVLLCARRHQGVELVKGVSFSVYPGECLGILGESGSGKSMSMKAAMGLLDHGFHVLGSAKFQGEELLGKSDEELRRLRGGQVGIILQNPMTCFDPSTGSEPRLPKPLRPTITGARRISSSDLWRCWGKCGFVIRKRCWRSTRISSPAECFNGS